MQSNRWLQALLVLLVIIASVYLAGIVWSFIVQFSTVLLLFFLSWLLAFVLRPFARMLNNRGLSYGGSVLVVYLALAFGVVVVGYLLIPIIMQQISELINNFDSYVKDGEKLVNSVQDQLLGWGVRAVDITKFYQDLAGQVQTVGVTVLTNIFSLLQGIATLIFQLVLVLLLSFYFMKDGEQIFGGLLHLLPPRWQDEATLLAMSIEKSFGAFVRGQLLFALIYAVLNGGVMLAFGLDYVVLASIVAGFSMLIPLVGNYLAFTPPVLVCLVTPDKADQWPWVLLVCFIVQSIQMNVIGPRIMSQAIGIHPLYVMGAMLIGAQVAGFWGAIFGIPIAGTMNLVGRPLMRRLRFQTSLYREADAGQLTTRSFATGPLRASAVDQYEKAKLAGRYATTAGASAEDQTIEATESAEPVEAQSTVPHPMPPSPYDYDLDGPPQPRTPTLTARMWHFAWVLVSRAYTWVGARAHVRSSRRP